MSQDTDRTIEQLTEELTALDKQIANLQKSLIDALYKRGVAYLKQGDPPAALADFDAVLKRKPSYAKACYYRGVSHLHLEEWVQARQDLADAKRAV